MLRSTTAFAVLVLGLVLLALPASAGKPRLSEEDARSLVALAVVANDLRGAPTAFRVEADLELAQPGGETIKGKYALLWVGPDKWRREYLFPGYRDVRVQTGENTAWRVVPEQPVPTVLVGFEDRFLGAVGLREDAAVKGGKLNAENVSCLSLSSEGTPELEQCIDADDGFLVSSWREPWLVERSGPREVAGRLCPSVVKMHFDGRLVLTARSTTLEAVAEPDPRAFEEPAGAVLLGAEATQIGPGDVIPPEAIRKVPLRMPSRAKGAQLASEVVLDIIVEVDGSVAVAKVFSTSGRVDVDQAAIEAAMQSVYRPAVFNGQPRAVHVVYRFRLGQ